MFQVGGPEFLVIVIVALIAVGPDQLPSVVRKMGRWASQFRSMTSGLRTEFMAGIDELEASVREPLDEISATFREPAAELKRVIEDPDGDSTAGGSASSVDEAADAEGASRTDEAPRIEPFSQNSTTSVLGLSQPAEEAAEGSDLDATDGEAGDEGQGEATVSDATVSEATVSEDDPEGGMAS